METTELALRVRATSAEPTGTWFVDDQQWSRCAHCGETIFEDAARRPDQQWVHYRTEPDDMRPLYTYCRRVTDAQITDRPWRGPCATTRRTMEDYRRSLEIADAWQLPPAVTRAAVAVCRAYGIRGLCDPAYISNVVAGELHRAGLLRDERYDDDEEEA